jgi:hypothetical protein
MKMKRVASLLLLLSVVFFTQCNNKVEPEPGPDPIKNPEGKSKVSLNILIPKSNASTYAGVDATAYENHIDTLYVMLYQGSNKINDSTFYGGALTKITGHNDSIVELGYEVDNITSTSLRAEVFANSKTVRILNSPDSIRLPKGDAATSFFMSGKKDFVYEDGIYKAVIPLQRNVAKIRVNVSKHSVVLPSDLTIDYDNIKIKTNTMADRTELFGPEPNPGSTNYVQTNERTGGALHKSPSFNTTNGGQIDSFYVYENYRSDPGNGANATAVTIEIPTSSPTAGSKTDTRDYILYTSPDQYNLKRNYIYTLDIKVRGQSLEPVITTSVQPWDDVNVDGTIHGTYLTMDKSEIVFDSNGEATINFCTDAQAIYFDFEEFNGANTTIGARIDSKILYSEGIEQPDLNLAPSDFNSGQILLDKQQCGSFGFRIDRSEYPEFPAINFSGKICVRAGNIIKCLSFPGIRTYDAHFIVGDSIFNWNEEYTYASTSVESGDGQWIYVSNIRPYTTSTTWSNYGPGASTKLYLHLDENLTDHPRTGSVTVTTAVGGAEKTLHITQLPAIPVGRFGYLTFFDNDKDDSIYDAMLYTEQLYEYEATIPYKSSNDNDIPDKNYIYDGREMIKDVYEETPHLSSPYFDYLSTVYTAINYCAYKNRGSGTNGELVESSGDYKWYLPAQAQLMGMWLSYNSYKDELTSNFGIHSGNTARDDSIYWSATANDLYKNEAQYVNFIFGNVGHTYKNKKGHWTRCVRNGSTTAPTMISGTGGYPVIDFTKGMPQGSWDSQSKGTGIGNEKESNNKTLFHKLRVATKDTCSSGSDWSNALAACAAYTESGTAGWRLPTQRELQAIWILQNEIKSIVSAFSLLSDNYYWSATESSTSWINNIYTNAWMVYGGKNAPGGAGNTPHSLKASDTPVVRCVREE